jgi:cysteine desulfurase
MIYLDYAATTPMDPRVLEAMLPYFGQDFGNASSIHAFGQKARKAIDAARSKCIELLGAFGTHEIIFTGSGTESCNMAIMGAAFARQEQGRHIIISAIEHPAVREAAHYLRDNFGFELTELNPNSEGLIVLKDLESAITDKTILISVIYANNEIGTVQPIKEIAALAREKGILFHTDACQAPGYLNINVNEIQPDLMSLNGSKIHGPKGVGLLYIREGLKITPHIHGGGQEFRMRGGTESTANIVGFAKALELTLSENHQEKTRKLRDQLLEDLLKIPGIVLNGSLEHRLVNNINLHTPGVLGETLVMRLDIAGLAASSGSACASGKTEASHVLLALGQNAEQAQQSLRLTLGRTTTGNEITEAAKILTGILG